MQLVSLANLQQQSENPTILKALVTAHRHLAELKGVAKTIPNQAILLSTLGLQEAQDSSAIENIITTQDALLKYRLQVDVTDVAAKEVSAYADGLMAGYQRVREHGLIRNHHRFYSQDLINNIFRHPYTKVQFLEDDLKVSRATATRYLDALAADGVLEKHKLGRENYYLNKALVDLLFNVPKLATK